MNQPKIRRIEALRLQGFSYKEIADQVDCSERTARRYGNGVQPRLQLPGQQPDPKSMDPGTIRSTLANDFMEALYNDRGLRAVTVVIHFTARMDGWSAEYDNPPSILFMNEAERLIGRALDRLGAHSVRMLARDVRSKRRFLREVVGALYADYIAWHDLEQQLNPEFDKAPYWRPPSERPEPPEVEYANPYGFPED